MPRDGAMPAPRQERPPTREEILAQIRQQNSGHLIEQIISLEADKAVLINELVAARRRIAELDGLRDIIVAGTSEGAATVEPTDAVATDL